MKMRKGWVKYEVVVSIFYGMEVKLETLKSWQEKTSNAQ